MIFNRRYLFILVTVFVTSSAATYCSNSTLTDDKNKACFLESSKYNPGRLRTSGNSLVLPCHVAHSKHSTVEWWYQDFQRKVHIKIYPVFPAVRPTVLRFITNALTSTKNINETDTIDVSILLRHVNVDDSGIYTCVIRPWTKNPVPSIDDSLPEDYSTVSALSYHVELSGPRTCQPSVSLLPCFSNMRTSSPTILDAYQTAFLQCVVQNHNRPVSVFWVVGNLTTNSVLITDFLTTNQNNGDRLRRLFPLSLYDFSIEITINRDTRERTYSCVIDGNGDVEATLFSYIVRAVDFEEVTEKNTKARKIETVITHETDKEKFSTTTTTTTTTHEKIVPHNSLTPDEVEELRQKQSHEHAPKKSEKSEKKSDDDVEDKDDIDGDLSDFERREETESKS